MPPDDLKKLIDEIDFSNPKYIDELKKIADEFGVGVEGLVKGTESAGISSADKAKISQWSYPPSEELYIKNKAIYDNPKYFDQKTGNAIYPGMNGDPNIDGFTNGQYKMETLKPGTVIDRYGSNPTGKYFSPAGSSYESRALPPYMESQPYTKYEVLKPLEVKSGEIAPWFNQSGKGTQYLTDLDVKNLLRQEYIKIIH